MRHIHIAAAVAVALGIGCSNTEDPPSPASAETGGDGTRTAPATPDEAALGIELDIDGEVVRLGDGGGTLSGGEMQVAGSVRNQGILTSLNMRVHTREDPRGLYDVSESVVLVYGDAQAHYAARSGTVEVLRVDPVGGVIEGRFEVELSVTSAYVDETPRTVRAASFRVTRETPVTP